MEVVLIAEKREHEQILQKYDPAGEYLLNKKYSSADKQVYTRTDDKYCWLVADMLDKKRLRVTMTDDNGKIILRDDYEKRDGLFICRERWRAKESVRGKLAARREQISQRNLKMPESDTPDKTHKSNDRSL